MQHRSRRVLSVLLVVLLFCGAAPAGLPALRANAAGDLVTFGSYPQSLVRDSATVNALNGMSKTWKSYRYVSGSGEYTDGQIVASDYMQYADVQMGTAKYRAVTFSKYRPEIIAFHAWDDSTIASRIPSNEYYLNRVYWFKYEPLQWRVLDSGTGLMLCESIIDSQPYHNYLLEAGTDENGWPLYWGNAGKTRYANNYAESSIRQWLNADFYNTAFTASQQAKIGTTTLDNRANEYYPEFDSATTQDKIFLLSRADALNSTYGFSSAARQGDAARRAKGTDYAKCQGLRVYDSKGDRSEWLLRTPGHSSQYAYGVDEDGYVDDNDNTYYTSFGVRPALSLYPGALTPYTVTWNVDGVTTRQTLTYGDPIVKPADPVKSGYSFTGWTPEVPAVMPKADLTFTATFAPKTYLAKLVADGVTVKTIEYTYGQKTIQLPDVPPKEGYTGVWPSYTLPIGGVTITAVYTKNQYTVTWNVGGNITVQTLEYGAPIVKPSAPVKEGYTFTGWSPAVPATMPAQNMTFTAQFIRNDLIVKVLGVTAENVALYYKDSLKLPVTVTTQNDAAYTVSYKPEKAGIVSIGEDGTIQTRHWGVTKVTVTVTDLAQNVTFTETCSVKVDLHTWQWIIIIFLLGWLWY